MIASMHLEREPISKTSETLRLMKKYGVSFDIDGVLQETSFDTVRKYNNEYGFKYKNPKTVYQLVEYYSMRQWLETLADQVGEDFDPMQTAIELWNHKQVQSEALAEIGVEALLKLLYRHEISPYAITSRPAASRDSTYNWIDSRFKNIGQLASKLNIQDGQMLNSKFKADKAMELNVLFHFDDAGGHAEEVASRGIIVGLVAKPWSEFYQPKNYLVVKPSKYIDRPPLIRAFLSVCDFVYENPQLVERIVKEKY